MGLQFGRAEIQGGFVLVWVSGWMSCLHRKIIMASWGYSLVFTVLTE